MEEVKRLIVLLYVVMFMLLSTLVSFGEISGQYYYSDEYSYSIIFPDGWLVKDNIGVSEKIDKKAIKENTNCSIMCTADKLDESVSDFADYTENDWEELINNSKTMYMQYLQNQVKNNVFEVSFDTFIVKRDRLGEYPFVKIEFEYNYPYSENEKIVSTSYTTYKNGNMYVIGTTMDKNTDEKTKINIANSLNSFIFGENKTINTKLNSNDINQDNGSKGFDNNEENFYNSILLTTIVGFLLTYGIGIGVPILYKNFLLKESVNKTKAIKYSVSWYIIQYLLWELVGSTSKTHFSLLITSLITYSILKSKKQKDISTNEENDDEVM
jgi:hypothetical protein